MRLLKYLAVTPVLLAGLAQAAEPVDLEMVTRIRDEGLNHSQVMQTLQHLTDVIGPRLTGSPQLKAAGEWARDTLAGWGLVNAELEPYRFGQGWSFSRTSLHMLEPHAMPLIALPQAWTPGTRKKIKGAVLMTKIESEEDLEKFRGKVKGKILLVDEPRKIEPPTDEIFRRYSGDQLEELTEFTIRDARDRRAGRNRREKRWKLGRALRGFMTEEGVLATVQISSRDGGLIRVSGSGVYEPDDNPGVPSVYLSAEQYNLISRFLKDDVAVELELEIGARFHTDDLMSYNTVAEIRGADLADQVVMVGAHLDSWHAGTGATDNASGCAVALEAVRILQALEVKPRRTIRVALWSGEEQGLLGSRAYVKQHFATRPPSEDPEQLEKPEFLRDETWPLQPLPEHAGLSAYFNLDNGSGRIRGIYIEENAAVKPIFEAWLAPLADLGAETVTMRRTGGTDHMAFNAVGLPGFQFIQDGLDYRSQTHHTNMDVYDHLQADDMKQASVVMATFLYQAAMRDAMIPRKPFPERRPDDEEKKEDADDD